MLKATKYLFFHGSRAITIMRLFILLLLLIHFLTIFISFSIMVAKLPFFSLTLVHTFFFLLVILKIMLLLKTLDFSNFLMRKSFISTKLTCHQIYHHVDDSTTFPPYFIYDSLGTPILNVTYT